MNESLPKSPTKLEDFTKKWASSVLEDSWIKAELDSNKVEIKHVTARLNGLQGLLSTTYIVDIGYEYEEEENIKSIFVKIPLREDGLNTYHEANLRELNMFTEILPKLQEYLVDKCTDVLQLPIPELIYCNYTGDGISDMFILENLLKADFQPFSDSLRTKEYLQSCLECIAQLHGTGLAYMFSRQDKEKGEKESEKPGIPDAKSTFPSLNEQSQIQDILQDKENKKSIRRNYLPFLKFLEKKDPSLSNFTAYLAKIDKNLIKILQRAGNCGTENLVTLCHGDAKPDNFLFRRIEIELDDLSCEGLEAILIDWQQTFLGNVTNDLMWLLPTFLEQADSSLEFALDYYFMQLKNVLASFGRTIEDFNLPDNSQEFQRILRSGFMLEFFSSIIINPILKMADPAGLRRWHQKVLRHEDRLKNGAKTRAPADPDTDNILHNAQFGKFANLYCKVAHILGVFPQIGTINVEIVKENMFRDEGEKDEEEDNDDVYEDEEAELSEEEEENDEETQVENISVFSRLYSWVIGLLGLCNKKK